MSDVPYYPPMDSARPQGGAGAPGPILLSAAGPSAQRRATVAVRLILAIPHLVALYFLGIAALVVAVIGWFGALGAGRLPRFAFTFLSGYLRWFVRVEAYLLLLTDEYPPFELEDVAYPVRLVASPGRLNRLTVLFRIILAIPAAIVSTLLTSGFATIMVFIAWLTALFAGQLPVSLHQAFAAVLRYTIRYYGYLYLLTDVYPAGLFGDAAPVQAGAAFPPGGPGYGTADPGQAAPRPGYGPPPAGYGPPGDYQDSRPPGYQAPGYGAAATRYDAPAPGHDTVGYGTPGYGAPAPGTPGYGAPGAPGTGAPGYGTPGYGTPGYGTAGYGTPGYGPGPGTPGYGTPWPAAQPVPAGSPGPGAGWELVLSSGARRLVVVVLLLGLLSAAGEGAWTGSVISAAIQRDREINQLNTDVAQYNTSVTQFNALVAQHNVAVTEEQQAAAQVTAASTALNDAQDSLDDALNSPGADSSNCQSVACFNTTALPVVNAFAAFGRTLNATPVPSGSAAIKKKLLTDTANDQQDWTEITQATSFSSIVTIATNAETVGGQFDNDVSALTTSLSNESTTLGNQATALSSAAPALNAKAAHLTDEGEALDQRAAALDVQVNLRTPAEAQ